jgi:hypothetical protein
LTHAKRLVPAAFVIAGRAAARQQVGGKDRVAGLWIVTPQGRLAMTMRLRKGQGGRQLASCWPSVVPTRVQPLAPRGTLRSDRSEFLAAGVAFTMR